MNLKLQLVSQALGPQLKKKKKNLKQMISPQKNAVGDQVALFANSGGERGTKQGATEDVTQIKVTRAAG